MKRLEYIALKVEGEFHWGFSVRLAGASAAARSYLVPPPTTLLGALARNLFTTEALMIKGRVTSSTINLLRAVKVATFKYLEGKEFFSLPVPFIDIIRTSRIPYLRTTHRREKERWFGVSGFGRIYAPSSKFNVLYI